MQLGQINVKNYLSQLLRDSYTYEERNEILNLKKNRSSHEFQVPVVVNITTNFLVWCGLYEAEGGKKGNISYHTDSPYEFNFFVENLNKILVPKSFQFGLNLCPRSVDRSQMTTLCKKYSDLGIKSNFPLDNLTVYEKAFFEKLKETPIKIVEVKLSENKKVALAIYRKINTHQFAYFNKDVEVFVELNGDVLSFKDKTDVHGFVHIILPDSFIKNIDKCNIKVKGENGIDLPNEELYESNYFVPHPFVDLKIKTDFNLRWGNQVHLREGYIDIPQETIYLKIKCLDHYERPKLAYDKKQVKYTKLIEVSKIDNNSYLDNDKKIKIEYKDHKLFISDLLKRKNLHYVVTIFREEKNNSNYVYIKGADSLSYEIQIPEIDFKYTKSWRTYKGGTTFDYKPEESSSMFDYVRNIARSVFDHFYLSKSYGFIESKYTADSVLRRVDLLEVFKKHNRHDYKIVSSDNNQIVFKKKRGTNIAKITRYLSISPSLLVSIGMFMGDGSNMMRIENKVIGYDLKVLQGISIVNQDITTVGIGYKLAEYLGFKEGLLGIEVLESFFKTIEDVEKYSREIEIEVKKLLKEKIPFMELNRLNNIEPFVSVCGTNAVTSKSGDRYNVKLLFLLDQLQLEFILDKRINVFDIRNMSLLGKLFYFSQEFMDNYKLSSGLEDYKGT